MTTKAVRDVAESAGISTHHLERLVFEHVPVVRGADNELLVPATRTEDGELVEHEVPVTHLVAYYGAWSEKARESADEHGNPVTIVASHHPAHRQVYPAQGVDAVKPGKRLSGDHAAVHATPKSFRPAVKK